MADSSIGNILLVAGAAGTVSAAVVSSFVIAFNGWRERIASAKRHAADIEAANLRHFRELALEAAITEWKQAIEDSKNWRPDPMRCQGEVDRPEVDPFDYFVLKKLKMIQTFGDTIISLEDLPAKWKEMGQFHKFMSGSSGRKGKEPGE